MFEALDRFSRAISAMSSEVPWPFVSVPAFGSNVYDWRKAKYARTRDEAEQDAMELAKETRLNVVTFEISATTVNQVPEFKTTWKDEKPNA